MNRDTPQQHATLASGINRGRPGIFVKFPCCSEGVGGSYGVLSAKNSQRGGEIRDLAASSAEVPFAPAQAIIWPECLILVRMLKLMMKKQSILPMAVPELAGMYHAF
jgi:hypothetical protein